jgi:hypothetical protein
MFSIHSNKYHTEQGKREDAEKAREVELKRQFDIEMEKKIGRKPDEVSDVFYSRYTNNPKLVKQGIFVTLGTKEERNEERTSGCETKSRGNCCRRNRVQCRRVAAVVRGIHPCSRHCRREQKE